MKFMLTILCLHSWKNKGFYTSVKYAKHFEVYVCYCFYVFQRIKIKHFVLDISIAHETSVL